VIDLAGNEIDALFVDPDCGGRGIGLTLMQAMEALADPARPLVLSASLNAVPFYRRCGFEALRDLLCAAGLNDPSELGPEHILRRVSPVEIRSLASLYRYLAPGELLRKVPDHAVFHDYWADARSDSFQPPARIQALRTSKSR